MVSASPKRRADLGSLGWYPYYAGYSEAFVRESLRWLRFDDSCQIIDPWNGAGTTTAVSARLGVPSVGVELNPAMVVVAKGRLLGSGVINSLPSLTQDIVQKAHDFSQENPLDPLSHWFSPPTAACIRSLQQGILSLLVEGNQSAVDRYSTLAAFFFTALFRTVRATLAPFLTSNQTWVKSNALGDGFINICREDLYIAFEQTATSMSRYIEENPEAGGTSSILSGDSRSIPLGDGATDGFITSPPYCTRIDYTVATLPELAVLGFDEQYMERMRKHSVGSPVVRGTHVSHLDERWGPTCIRTLREIREHDSKASKTYYHKFYWRYFDMLFRSLGELTRVSTSLSRGIIVVQDSYYKEILVNLPQVVIEMMDNLSWSPRFTKDFEVGASMVNLNSASVRYRDSSPARESALAFERRSVM